MRLTHRRRRSPDRHCVHDRVASRSATCDRSRYRTPAIGMRNIDRCYWSSSCDCRTLRREKDMSFTTLRSLPFALLFACSPSAMSVGPAHPANPDAPVGRLAGPPAALRPDVATIPESKPDDRPTHQHGAEEPTPSAPAPVTPAPDATPSTDPHAGHDTTTPATAKPEPTKRAPKKPAPKKPAPKPPASDPHAGHDMSDPHAGHDMAKPTPDPKPPAADPHAGHKGH